MTHYPLTVSVTIWNNLIGAPYFSTEHDGHEVEVDISLLSQTVPYSPPPSSALNLLTSLERSVSPPSGHETSSSLKKKGKKARRGSFRFQYDSDLDSVVSDSPPSSVLLERPAIDDITYGSECEGDLEDFSPDKLVNDRVGQIPVNKEDFEEEKIHTSSSEPSSSPSSIFTFDHTRKGIDEAAEDSTTFSSISEDCEEGEIDEGKKVTDSGMVAPNFNMKDDIFEDAKRTELYDDLQESEEISGAIDADDLEEDGAGQGPTVVETDQISIQPFHDLEPVSTLSVPRQDTREMEAIPKEKETVANNLSQPSCIFPIDVTSALHVNPAALSDVHQGIRMYLTRSDEDAKVQEKEPQTAIQMIEHPTAFRKLLAGMKRKRKIDDDNILASTEHNFNQDITSRPKKQRRKISWQAALSHTASLAVGAAAAVVALALMPELNE